MAKWWPNFRTGAGHVHFHELCLMKLRWQICVLMLLAAGCSGRPGAIRPPDVDADAAAELAVELHDRNGDGHLAKDEWSASPALVAVAPSYDKNRDDTLSVDEITTGFAGWNQSGVGARVVPFTLTWNGRPLPGATVRLAAAPFFDGALKGASGQSGPGGTGQLDMAPEDRPHNAPDIRLMQPGLYHVEITHPSVKIPEKFNSQTTLGIEITGSNPGPEGITWSLSSK
jgi:hypothetical protein